jgi:hypothetical protein
MIWLRYRLSQNGSLFSKHLLFMIELPPATMMRFRERRMKLSLVDLCGNARIISHMYCTL